MDAKQESDRKSRKTRTLNEQESHIRDVNVWQVYDKNTMNKLKFYKTKGDHFTLSLP